jgi:hypothetical protein
LESLYYVKLGKERIINDRASALLQFDQMLSENEQEFVGRHAKRLDITHQFWTVKPDQQPKK